MKWSFPNFFLLLFYCGAWSCTAGGYEWMGYGLWSFGKSEMECLRDRRRGNTQSWKVGWQIFFDLQPLIEIIPIDLKSESIMCRRFQLFLCWLLTSLGLKLIIIVDTLSISICGQSELFRLGVGDYMSGLFKRRRKENNFWIRFLLVLSVICVIRVWKSRKKKFKPSYLDNRLHLQPR